MEWLLGVARASQSVWPIKVVAVRQNAIWFGECQWRKLLLRETSQNPWARTWREDGEE